MCGQRFFENARRIVLHHGWEAHVQQAAQLEKVVDPNTPIYVAARLIQRFDRPTPPASYMHAVGGAFRSGAYEVAARASAVTLQRPQRRFYWQTMPLRGSRQSLMIGCASPEKLIQVLWSWGYMDPQGISVFNHE